MRIAILFKTIDGPWGGGNSFLRSLKSEWRNQGVEITDRIDGRLDGVLVNSSYLGPGRRLTPDMAARLVRHGHTGLLPVPFGLARWQGGRRPPFVHRLDGVFRLYGRPAGDPADADQISINRLMDWTIFQSKYCQDSFGGEGLDTSRSTVVLNGVDLNRFSPAGRPPDSGVLRLVAVAWSSNLSKGFPATVEASRVPGVSVTFVGNWPSGLDHGTVQLVPPQDHANLPDLLKQHHAMLHMAENDPCSNAILEGMASGLPVIYHPSGGTPELVKDCGVPGQPSLSVAIEQLRDQFEILRERVMERRLELSVERAARFYLRVFENLGRRQS